MEEPLVASEYGSEWIYSCRFRVGGGKGCCWVEGRRETEDAGSLLSESCLIPWKPVIHKPNYVQVECHLWQNETNASFVWLGFLMKSCFTSRFYFHKCLFKKKKSQIISFPTHSWEALISVSNQRAVGCCRVHFAKRERKTWGPRERLSALPLTPPHLSEHLGLAFLICKQKLFN